MKCGAVEWVKRNTLRWFGHMERMNENEMTKRVYRSEVDAVGVRGRPPVKWEDRVIKNVNEGVRIRGLENAREECKNREKWRLLPWPSPEGEFLG